MDVIEVKKEFKPFEVDIAEDLVVAISQYKSVDCTCDAIKALRESVIPFTSIILYDGTHGDDITEEILKHTDIMLYIKKRINSLPHVWNMLYGVAKLTRAKYMLLQDCDIVLKNDSLKSMMGLLDKYDIISPIKIDKDIEKFNDYTPISDKPMPIVGFNDSIALIKLENLPFFPYDYDYAPYQFEISALSYDLYNMGLKSVLDPNAVAFHRCSTDIQHSPENRTFGSSTWDDKKELFLKKGENREEFLEKVIMNSENATKFGFPCYLGEKI